LTSTPLHPGAGAAAVGVAPTRAVAWSLTSLLCAAHALAIWIGMGGSTGIASPWPLARHDHPLYFHSARITPRFLRLSATTAGYDPAFMSGYAKSVIFPASSTLPELVFFCTGAADPVRTYKIYVLIAAASIPFLVAVGGVLWRLSAGAVAWGVGLFVVYVWTDFPINYAEFGMLPYLAGIPLALCASAAICRFVTDGGLGSWLAAATLSSLAFCVHFTSAMIVAPAALAAYAAAQLLATDASVPLAFRRHAGFWSIPLVVLLLNAFWWWPGVLLANTKGESGFAFSHSDESVLGRLAAIVTHSPRIELVLWLGAVGGGIVCARRDRVAACGLAGWLGAGFFWGYAAGAFPSLDFLQPGRHTYALYTAAALAGGVCWDTAVKNLGGRLKMRIAVALILLLAAVWAVGPACAASLRFRLRGPQPFLSSRPSPLLRWVVDRVQRHVHPGERLLYEEGGFDVPGAPDPFHGGRYSGLLPYYAPGIEVLGGPYLHAALTTNSTQFGEDKLFGVARWGPEHFRAMARLYRPAAIVCWTPWSKAFCRAHPELVDIVEERAPMLFGRVRGFGGSTIDGTAEVQAETGRLRIVCDPARLDGTVVLRYHSVPCLRSRPPVRLESVSFPGDPVPFIGLKPPPGVRSIELELAP
jgi:hypothetical protein